MQFILWPTSSFPIVVSIRSFPQVAFTEWINGTDEGTDIVEEIVHFNEDAFNWQHVPQVYPNGTAVEGHGRQLIVGSVCNIFNTVSFFGPGQPCQCSPTDNNLGVWAGCSIRLPVVNINIGYRIRFEPFDT